ncbi:MAG TPA: hypothetical protein DCP28_14985, partial [Cytophagales bacterium]|nr:hypothetical protein [Cytophagales bacterium]
AWAAQPPQRRSSVANMLDRIFFMMLEVVGCAHFLPSFFKEGCPEGGVVFILIDEVENPSGSCASPAPATFPS